MRLSRLLIAAAFALGLSSTGALAQSCGSISSCPAATLPLTGLEAMAGVQNAKTVQITVGAIGQFVADPPGVKGCAVYSSNCPDDTAAIQAAINATQAAGGGTITLAGHPVYRVHKLSAPALTVTASNVHLQCVAGVTQIVDDVIYDGTPHDSTDVNLINIAGSNVILRNISIDGCTFAFASAFSSLGTQPIISAQDVDGYAFRNGGWYYGSYGQYLHQVQDFQITGNYWHDTYADGLQGSNAGSTTLGMTTARGVVANNIGQRTGDDTIAFGGVIGVSGYSKSNNIVIANNVLGNNTRVGGLIGIYGVDGFVVSNNKMDQPAGQCLAAVTDTNNSQDTNTNGLIIGNNCTSNNPSPGSTGGVGGPQGFYLVNRNSSAGTTDPAAPLMYNVTVADNVFSLNDRSCIWSEMSNRYDVPPYTDYSVGVTLRHNRCVYTGSSATTADWRGINFIRSKDLTLDGNVVIGFPANAQVTYYGINLSNVNNNYINNNASSSFSAFPAVAIGADVSWETIKTISGNQYYMSASTATYLLYVNIQNNTFNDPYSDWFYSTGATIIGNVNWGAGGAPINSASQVGTMQFSATNMFGLSNSGDISLFGGGMVGNGAGCYFYGGSSSFVNTMFCNGDKFNFRNEAGSATVFEVDTATPTIKANGVTGVVCSGSPTSSFATSLGLVTHC